MHSGRNILYIIYNGTNITECVPHGINCIEYLYQQNRKYGIVYNKASMETSLGVYPKQIYVDTVGNIV